MPIISRIGRRSWKVRVALALIYFTLIVGAVTMIYPLLLMLSGSVKSETDFRWVSPVPQYLYNDDILWMKYIESKYTLIPQAEAALHRPIGSWINLRPPQQIDNQTVELFREFRDKANWPLEWYRLGHSGQADKNKILAKNGRKYRQFAQERYHEDVAAFSIAAGVEYSSWAHVAAPLVPFAARRFNFPTSASYTVYYDLKAQSPKEDWDVINLDGDFWENYLVPVWANIDVYNKAHGTHFTDYQQVMLTATPPALPTQRADWEDYVRHFLNVAFIRFDPSALARFHSFLQKRYKGIAELNTAWETTHARFEDVPLPQGVPRSPRAQVDVGEFVKDKSACPLDALSIYGPRQGFERLVADKRGVPVDQVAPLLMPVEAADYADLRDHSGSVRWEFVRRNYLTVWDYLWMHGNGVRNTAIYCTLAVLTSLLINPLAAYALSRFRPPSTYKVLLFCMATMAFPAEVTMIPSFLLLKRFPLMNLFVAVIAIIVAAWSVNRPRHARIHWSIKGVFVSTIGILAGWWLAPWIATHVFHRADTHVSLLNTFWALILPHMANGFSIFLLKGFFDSLPQELYEAAEIDGAGEWTKFWLITMTLSKPILAVLALDAFNIAYGQFMMALVIIPDPKMWTMMVWLFQLQSFSHPSVVYASLVIAAIPTMLIFLLCQNLILRGLVVPTEK